MPIRFNSPRVADRFSLDYDDGSAVQYIQQYLNQGNAMSKQRKVIISCAITGGIHTPSMSPYLPVTAAQIEESAVGAIEAGAAIVHLHARIPEDGKPKQAPELFSAFIGNIKRRTDGVLNITTGGAPTMTVEERLQPAMLLK